MPKGVPKYPDLDKIVELTVAERAYIAGFFDGEGYVSLHIAHNTKRNKDYVRVIIGIGQKRGPMLMWLHDLFGGSLFLHVRNDRGVSPAEGTLSRWSIVGKDHLQLFYRVVRPYLRLKGEELDIAMRTWNDPHVTIEEAKETIDRIRHLRAVGE